jgi:hypothetical protein
VPESGTLGSVRGAAGNSRPYRERRTAGWFVEALRYWGLVPGSSASTSVATAHESEAAPLVRQGYSVRPMYSGAYSDGDLMLSEATRGDEFLALSTTNHATVNRQTTCTPQFDKVDAAALRLVSGALRNKGLATNEIQACVLPLHPNESNRLVGDRRQSPAYMTPSHGTVAWSTNVHAPRGNLVTAIRSPVIRANLRFAQMPSGRWTFDMTRA